MVMYPGGHARNTNIALHEVLQHKFKNWGLMALNKNDLIRFKVQLENIGEMTEEELQDIYDCNIKFTEDPIDQEPHDPKNKLDDDSNIEESSKTRTSNT